MVSNRPELNVLKKSISAGHIWKSFKVRKSKSKKVYTFVETFLLEGKIKVNDVYQLTCEFIA